MIKDQTLRKRGRGRKGRTSKEKEVRLVWETEKIGEGEAGEEVGFGTASLPMSLCRGGMSYRDLDMVLDELRWRALQHDGSVRSIARASLPMSYFSLPQPQRLL